MNPKIVDDAIQRFVDGLVSTAVEEYFLALMSARQDQSLFVEKRQQIRQTLLDSLQVVRSEQQWLKEQCSNGFDNRPE